MILLSGMVHRLALFASVSQTPCSGHFLQLPESEKTKESSVIAVPQGTALTLVHASTWLLRAHGWLPLSGAGRKIREIDNLPPADDLRLRGFNARRAVP